IVIDIGSVDRLDTAGAWLIERLAAARLKAGADVEIVGASQAAQTLLPAVRRAIRSPDAAALPREPFFLSRWLELLGRAVERAWQDFVAGTYILGATIRGAQMKLGRGHAVNPAAIFNQIDRMGVGAIPVVVLIC